MIFFSVFLLVILIFMFLVFMISFLAYYKVFYVNKKKISDVSKMTNSVFTDEELEKISILLKNFKDDQYENVSIESFDGIKLNAKYYQYYENAPLQIMFHGYRSEGMRDFAGGMKLAKELKHNVLMVEHRGHGISEKSTTSFGILEKYDCLYWARYAANRFGENTKIILTGISMGASTVLMASSLKMPKNVVGIIADSPYSSPNDIIVNVLKNKKIPSKFVMPFIKIGALVFGGFKLDKYGAVDEVKNSNIPMLIIHGECDSLVPYYMSKEIYYNSSSKKELRIFENAEHCRNYLVNEKLYTNIVMNFISNLL